MSIIFLEDKDHPNDAVVAKEPIDKCGTSIVSHDIDEYIEKFLDISNNAKNNDKKEKSMTLIEGLKNFPKAAGWSVVIFSAIIMEGYDTTLMASFFGVPAFKEKYGEYSNGSYEIPTRWQTGIQVSVNVGEIIGLL